MKPTSSAVAETAAATETARQGGTFAAALHQALQRHPDRIAVIDDAGAVSYAELRRKVAVAVQRLGALGLAPGDAVAQLSGNRVEMLAVMMAAYIGGFRSVTLHPKAGVADYLAVLQDCGARVLITEAAMAESLTAAFREPFGAAFHWLSHDADGAGALQPFWPAVGTAGASSGPAGTGSAEPDLPVRGDAESVVRLAYTGGTTGRPKGVMLSNRAMLANTMIWLSALAWPDGARTLCSAPISHGAGSLIWPTFLRGGTVVLERGFVPGRWLQVVAEERIQFTFIVPTMLYALLDHPDIETAALGSLTGLIYGAAPTAPARIREALQRFGPVLVQTYGQTEAPNTILLLDQADHLAVDDHGLTAAGRPFPGLDVAVLDEQGRPVAVGEVGELCVRGPLVMSGYHGQPEQTREAMATGWLHTGDLARRDERGLHFIVDRKKDMIISGGFNIYAREVEDILHGHPAVADVAVIGVPDPRWGEIVVAVVVPRDAAANAGVDGARAEALKQHVRDAKGGLYAPKHIRFVDRLPLTGLGKADKRALRNDWQAHAATH